ncbi:MAG: N-acetyl-gamma-glutamyl-phosphate reductase [Nitrospinaceae bacterium]|nr:N-acetyl-gamma-glutamyl-phosphate reductase [Nitrospinaceae bacterium]MBT5369998.1 N-acetyl-gamma-glutamyl-phosphate reductase [Nitrospinaceae bacterium]MBT6393921.1 N-acetyl-gamma-glutamyl-phosphate reductase [Nitrospinaceae bacterium]
MYRIAVVGATGYTGFELLRLLASHGGVEVGALTSETYSGKEIGEVFPALAKIVTCRLQKFEPEVCEGADIVFCCLPHRTAMNTVPGLLDRGHRVVDFSADFRLRDHAVYEQWYKTEHVCPERIPEAVYGIPELYRDEIRGAKLVANPGCYPTGAILALAPLLRAGIVVSSLIVIDAKSGVSGAGRKAALDFQFSEVNEGFKAYGIGTHRHTPEIEQELSVALGGELRVSFTPHLVPMTRGILSTIYVEAAGGATEESARAALQEAYGNEAFIRLMPQGAFPNVSQVAGSNFLDIGLTFDERTGRFVIVTAIDNLVKGASGAAVQNMNILLGLTETQGLVHPGFWV